MSGYSYFADYYDILTDNIPYDKRGEYFNAILKQNGVSSGILVDLACGTGSLSEVFSSYGYDVIGIDNSDEMLSVALEKKIDSQSDILYLCQNMQEIDLFGTVDAVVCALDSLNHILNEEDIKIIFKKVSMFLNPNGVFVFDVNSVYKHQKVLSGETFVYDYEDVYCVWQNSECCDNVVDISLDIFGRSEDNWYERYSESFSERAYTHEEICSFIKEANLELVAYYEGDTFNVPSDKSERIVYVTRSLK